MTSLPGTLLFPVSPSPRALLPLATLLYCCPHPCHWGVLPKPCSLVGPPDRHCCGFEGVLPRALLNTASRRGQLWHIRVSLPTCLLGRSSHCRHITTKKSLPRPTTTLSGRDVVRVPLPRCRCTFGVVPLPWKPKLAAVSKEHQQNKDLQPWSL